MDGKLVVRKAIFRLRRREMRGRDSARVGLKAAGHRRMAAGRRRTAPGRPERPQDAAGHRGMDISFAGDDSLARGLQLRMGSL